MYEIVFNHDNQNVLLMLLFEFKGIMCMYSLSVLAPEKVKQVPSKYILAR